jgi:dephospho-CoA kinase
MFDAIPNKLAGLTGGIASGKSTASAMLAEAGAHIVDADHIAREVVQKGTPAWRAIVAHYGPRILRPDGQIDREALGALVFHDPDAKEALNRMVHPAVGEKMQAEIQRLAARYPEDLLVLDVPLLIESGWHAFLPLVILVYVPESVQKTRLMRRDGLSSTDAEARIRAQMPIEAKRAHADYIIDNSGSREATRRQVMAVYRRIMAGEPPAAAAGLTAQP